MGIIPILWLLMSGCVAVAARSKKEKCTPIMWFYHHICFSGKKRIYVAHHGYCLARSSCLSGYITSQRECEQTCLANIING
ncbi:uncharacterized protein DMAD_00519 [Drosophila madeirensis]|uniref:Pancreatic trypsin inhibitor n=1 Tax=Drosophila madeirensis TaxID=30013 RepID=A0AAU9FZ60_DROMD